MTFSPGIPASGQSLGSSRTEVLGNFTNYFNVLSQDHVAPNATGEGKHNKSTYPVHLAAADPVTIAGEVAVYCKLLAAVPTLFLRPENSGTPINFFPTLKTSNVVIAGNPQFQYSFAFGGIRMTWGFAFNCPNNTIITFAIPFSAVPQCLQLTVQDPGATSILLNIATGPTNAQFSIHSSSNISFTYFVLGIE